MVGWLGLGGGARRLGACNKALPYLGSGVRSLSYLTLPGLGLKNFGYGSSANRRLRRQTARDWALEPEGPAVAPESA